MTTQHRALVVFGTRPEFIKVAPLIHALQADSRYDVTTCFTGQHPDMVKPLLEWFNITPDHTLSVMAHKQPLAQLSGKLLDGLNPIIEQERPDTLFIQGDTTTAFMAALNGYYAYDYYVRKDTDENQRQKLNIAHIEAGLRTYDNYSPFPEEANRRLIGHLSTHHFAPTAMNAKALHDERLNQNVFITGNTVIDALHWTAEKLRTAPRNPFASLNLPEGTKTVLITGHRRESYGEGFQNICRALRILCQENPEVHFVYPVHLNKHVQEPVKELLGGIANMHLIAPLDYPDFVAAMQQSYLLLTDSGGLQEEGPSLGKPVLVMREKTERQEAIAAGTVRLVGTTTEGIVRHTTELLNDELTHRRMAKAINPYGDGKTCQRILNILAGDTLAENTFVPQVEVA